jgi:general stress protein YciG
VKLFAHDEGVEGNSAPTVQPAPCGAFSFKENLMASNNQGGNQGGNQRGDTSNRGFASMDKDRQREIASEGGKAAHQSGNANEFTSEEAREAGRKGGQASGGNQGGSGGNR